MKGFRFTAIAVITALLMTGSVTSCNWLTCNQGNRTFTGNSWDEVEKMCEKWCDKDPGCDYADGRTSCTESVAGTECTMNCSCNAVWE